MFNLDGFDLDRFDLDGFEINLAVFSQGYGIAAVPKNDENTVSAVNQSRLNNIDTTSISHPANHLSTSGVAISKRGLFAQQNNVPANVPAKVQKKHG